VGSPWSAVPRSNKTLAWPLDIYSVYSWPRCLQPMEIPSVLQRFGGRLWSAPAFLPYVQPPLTEECVAAAERQHAVRLPLFYVAMLRQQNGGYLRGVRGVSTCLAGIGPKFPSIVQDNAWWRPRHGTPEVWVPPCSELLVPFDGDGHWDMCFDYRLHGGLSEPAVTYVSCESECEESIAPSFESYLASLEDSLAADTRLYGEFDAELVAHRLADRLRTGTPTVDNFAHGYDQWRLRMPGDAEWIWCSPNRVPTGFDRVGDKVTTTETTTLQILEDPGCSVLVAVTDGSRSRCLDALASLGFKMHGPSDPP
jgi:hypothetical protein